MNNNSLDHLYASNAIEMHSKILLNSALKQSTEERLRYFDHFLSVLDTEAASILLATIAKSIDSNLYQKCLGKLLFINHPNQSLEILQGLPFDFEIIKICLNILIRQNKPDIANQKAVQLALTTKNITEPQLDYLLNFISRIEKNIAGSLELCNLLIKVKAKSPKLIQRIAYFLFWFGAKNQQNIYIEKYKNTNVFDDFIGTSPDDIFNPRPPKKIELIFNKKGKIVFFTAIWGKEYCELFNTTTLDSLLTTNGFNILATKLQIEWLIYTDEQSKFLLEESLIKLRKIGVNVILDSEFLGAGYQAFSRRGLAFREALVVAKNLKCKFIQVPPDSLYGEGIDILVDKCQPGGVSGLNVLRIFKDPVIKASKTGLLNNLYKCENRNSKFFALGLSDWSHFFSRKTVLESANRAPERDLNYLIGQSIIESKNGSPCAYVFAPNETMISDLDENAGWVYGEYGDRWLNATDHYIPWKYSRTNQFQNISSSEQFCYFDLCSAKSYNHAIKALTGMPRYLYDKPKEFTQLWDYKLGRDWLINLPLQNNGFNYRHLIP